MKGLFFTYLLAYGGSLISLFNPLIGLLIYIAFANLKPESLWYWSVPAGNYSRIIACFFLVGWVVNGMGDWRLHRAKSLIILLCLYWLWLFVEAVRSPNQADAWYTFEILSKVFLPMAVSMTLIDSVEKLKQLAWVLTLSQGYLAFEFNITYYTQGIDTYEWYFAGIDNNGIAITAVTAMGLAFFIGITTEKLWQRLVAFASAALLAHVVLFSMSRGGMLAMGISGAVSFILIPKKPIYIAMYVLAALLVFRLAGEDVREEFNTIFADSESRDYSAQSRVEMWKDAIDCTLKNPVFGCGMENWGNVAPEYGWRQGKRVHNTWLELSASIGIPGLLLNLSLYLVTIWKIGALLYKENSHVDPWLLGLARAVITGLSGFLVSATFVTADRVELPYYVILLGAGVLKLSLQPQLQTHFTLGGTKTTNLSPELPLPVTAHVL
jgi:putative inorganic carbon (hco3(-)) transporter